MAEPFVEVHRGPMLECVHQGHAAIWRHGEGIIGAWGDAEARILPRSSSKMIQALPLVESGAANAHGLSDEHLALACASHNGAEIHTSRVNRWLSDMGLGESDLRCGSHWPKDEPARDALICSGHKPDQCHNNCSGKHTGFLALTQHLGAGPEYLEMDHPVQRAVSEAWDSVTDDTNPDYAIDGCSAPNFTTRLDRLARAMAEFAAAEEGQGARADAMVRLRNAMMRHPDLVAGEGRACTRLMRAMEGRAAVKTGAEGVFIAIIPEHKVGIALKIADGATRGSEAAITALLASFGVLDPDHPDARAFSHGPITNCNGLQTGHYAVAETLTTWRP